MLIVHQMSFKFKYFSFHFHSKICQFGVCATNTKVFQLHAHSNFLISHPVTFFHKLTEACHFTQSLKDIVDMYFKRKY